MSWFTYLRKICAWIWCYAASSVLMVLFSLFSQEEEHSPPSGSDWLLTVNKWIDIGCNHLVDLTKNWKTRHKYRQSVRLARSYHSNPPRSRYPVMAIFALQAVAMAATNTHKLHNASFDTDSGPVGIDNRCSACISHRLEDFVEPPVPVNRVIKGFGGSRMSNIKMGTIKWKWEDDTGLVHDMLIPDSYYAPDAGVRLLSPQHWSQHHGRQQHSRCVTRHDQVTLSWGDSHTKTVPLDHNNVATFALAPGYKQYHAFCAQAETSDVQDDTSPMCFPCVPDTIKDDDSTNIRMTPLECGFDFKSLQEAPEVSPDPIEVTHASTSAEFLHYHHKFGHISPKKIQLMAKQGLLPAKLATCPVPICTACLYGTSTKRPWQSKPSATDKARLSPITSPGQCVHVDFMTSPTPGFIAQLTGALTYKRYNHAAIYVDRFTGYGFVHLQKSISEEETLQGKLAFEAHCRQHNVTVRHYHADNGIFAGNGWRNACRQEGQGLSFAGVNAHHQNGVAERRIRTLQDMARTMLIHAHKRWPNAITANLWPYALRMANDSINATPSLQVKGNTTPVELFANTKVATNPKYWFHFGCPVYVLAEQLQSSKPIFHKWKERARVGLYLGKSPSHSREVALVLNLETGLVSPQFHVKLDSTFQTLREPGTDIPQSQWQIKAGFVAQPKVEPKVVHTSPDDIKGNISTTSSAPSKPKQDQVNQNISSTIRDSIMGVPIDSEGVQTPETVPEEPPLRRSSRRPKPIERWTYAACANIEHEVQGEILCLSAFVSEDNLDENPLLSFAASADPDTMYLHQAMKEPDREEFVKAMTKEVEGQLKNGTYSILSRSQVPKNERVLPAVWAMKRKRRIATGEIYKWKARLNLDGSKQIKGQDYWETNSPVANWSSIRLLLIMSIVNKWHTRQIDFVQAYTQAEVEKDMYMEIPRGFNVSEKGDFVLKIHKNIYGQKQAGRVWNNHLVDKLIQIGFKQCDHDPCVFTKGQNIYVLYVDDSILMGPNPKELDSLIQQMRDASLDLTVEGDVSDFLGVNVEYKKDGTVHLTQPQLIKSILEELHLMRDDVKGKNVPAATSKLLTSHQDSEPFDEHFNYRRVIGKLNYLERSSRPDIACAVHQCARFVSDPRVEHGQAVKWLGRYLKTTADKGLILRPKGDSFEVYVDADFAGNWNPEDAPDHSYTARSRHGYIIMYQGCPIVWASKMQTEIALSSTESEFIGLSMALRNTIPLMELIKELQAHGFKMSSTQPKVHCRVFEDNSGALEIAKVPKMRPRTKHINIKYHHFRDYVERGEITIHPIRSEDQPADLLTKPVPEPVLRKHREFIMGWKGKLGGERECENTRRRVSFRDPVVS